MCLIVDFADQNISMFLQVSKRRLIKEFTENYSCQSLFPLFIHSFFTSYILPIGGFIIVTKNETVAQEWHIMKGSNT